MPIHLKWITSRFVVSALLSTTVLADEPRALDLRAFGAVGDGKADDTPAVQKALDACAIGGGGEVTVPAGTYRIGSVQVGGKTIIRLEKDAVLLGSDKLDDYPMMDVRWEGRWQPGHRALIYFGSVDHVGIIGPGRIEGNATVAASQNPRGAVVLEAISCNDVRWEGFTLTQGGNWATHPTYCTDVVIKDVTITGKRDGIDVDSCKGVRIEHCDIDTGDDSISLKSGRGAQGARVGKPTEDVTISNCTLKDRNFACLGIGSEISCGVRNIRIEHCKLTAKSFAIYLKSRVGRAGLSENITGDDLDITGGGFLKINLTSAGNTNTVDDPVEGELGIPSARNLTFSNVRVSDANHLVDATDIAAEKPLDGFVLSKIRGIAAKGISLRYMTNVAISGIDVTGESGPALAIDSVTGTGLEGAAHFTATTKATTKASTRKSR